MPLHAGREGATAPVNLLVYCCSSSIQLILFIDRFTCVAAYQGKFLVKVAIQMLRTWTKLLSYGWNHHVLNQEVQFSSWQFSIPPRVSIRRLEGTKASLLNQKFQFPYCLSILNLYICWYIIEYPTTTFQKPVVIPVCFNETAEVCLSISSLKLQTSAHNAFSPKSNFVRFK